HRFGHGGRVPGSEAQGAVRRATGRNECRAGAKDPGGERVEHCDGKRTDRGGEEGRGGGRVKGDVFMTTVSTKPMSADEFWDFVHRPENADRDFELVRGEVVEMTKPGKRHGFVCANVVSILWSFARQRKKGYVCSNDTGVLVEHDPDTVRGPDVLFF